MKSSQAEVDSMALETTSGQILWPKFLAQNNIPRPLQSYLYKTKN
jgi:hypothetical protein